MYDRPALGVAQVQAAIAAMVEEGPRHPDQPVAIAMVDEIGDIIGYARMDNCRKFPQRLAIKKAYTCALSGSDSQAYVDRLKSQGRSVSDFGDPNLAAVPGGVVIRRPSDNAILGGIGVSGLPSGADDEAIARIGLNALNLQVAE